MKYLNVNKKILPDNSQFEIFSLFGSVLVITVAVESFVTHKSIGEFCWIRLLTFGLAYGVEAFDDTFGLHSPAELIGDAVDSDTIFDFVFESVVWGEESICVTGGIQKYKSDEFENCLFVDDEFSTIRWHIEFSLQRSIKLGLCCNKADVLGDGGFNGSLFNSKNGPLGPGCR